VIFDVHLMNTSTLRPALATLMLKIYPTIRLMLFIISIATTNKFPIAKKPHGVHLNSVKHLSNSVPHLFKAARNTEKIQKKKQNKCQQTEKKSIPLIN